MRWYIHNIIFIIFLLARPVFAANAQGNDVITGDLRMDNYLPMLQGRKVGVIINQTSRAGDALLLDALIKRGVTVTKIFTPEHGLRGAADAGAHINNGVDSLTGIPIISLYGKNKKPQKEQLTDVDVLVYDLQDVGVRFYTYISTLQYCLEAAAENDKDFIVLDRPNPNGFYVDGPVLDTTMRSFVGMQPIPIVYGMTGGEYAKMLVGEKWFNKAEKLHLNVISCLNYDHLKKYTLPVAPSPNLKNMAAVYYYPSLCLFEGTVISVGRGTDMPFQQWGSPFLNGKFAWHFTPVKTVGATSPLYENKVCYGEQLPVNEKDALKDINNGFQLKWLIEAYDKSPDKGTFFNDFFDKLAGTASLKEDIKNRKDEGTIKKEWQGKITAFKKIRKKYLLYKDFE